MLRSLRYSKYLLLIADIFGFLVAYQLAHLIRLGSLYPDFIVPGTPLFLPFVIGVFLVMDVYNPWTQYSRMGLTTRILPAVMILAIVLSLVAFLVFGPELQLYVGRGVLFMSLMIFGSYALISRFFFGRAYDQARMRNRWLIITEGRFLEPIYREIRRSFPVWEVVFLVRDSSSAMKGPSGETVQTLKSALIPSLDLEWDGVVIAAESLSNDQTELLLQRRLAGLKVLDLLTFYERYFLKVPLYFVEHSHLIIGRGFFGLSNPVGHRIKAIMDYTIAACMLLVSIPLMLLISVAIWLDSGRPIFFRQQRTGRDGRTFDAYKFRTMIVGAEKMNPYTSKKDSRITRLGRFLRIARLDELPQLINILMGQMSLIGPRAEWTILTREYEQQIPFYNLRHLVRPGLTGWAQVLYPYGENIADTVHKLEYDLYYIKNYTALLDVHILLMTVRVVLFGGGR